MSIRRYLATKRMTVQGKVISKGQPLYAVKKGIWYFMYCFTSLDTAREVNRKFRRPTSRQERKTGWRRTPTELLVSTRQKVRVKS